jgi:hypothetical protein
LSPAYDIRAVEHLDDHCLRLTFADGLTGVVDLADRIARATGPMFEPLRDVSYFAQVSIDPELGTVVWPNGADMAPEVLHEELLSTT